MQVRMSFQCLLGQCVFSSSRGVSWLLLPAGNSQIAKGIPPPTDPTGNTWRKTKRGFKKGCEGLTLMLKWVCGNSSDDNKSQALASYKEAEGSLAEGLCSQGSQECSSADTSLPRGVLHHWSQRSSSPQTFLPQNVVPGDHFQLHPDNDPTHTSKTTEHQVLERVLIFELVAD